MRIATILVPTDYSPLSMLAMDYAADLARDHQGRLIILHVVETLGPENVTYGEAASGVQPAGYRRRLWDELHKVRIAMSDLPLDYALIEGDPAGGIIRTAAEKLCDLIVMATHGRSGLHRLLEGSVAEKVVRGARCPVLVVKTPAPATPSPSLAGSDLHPEILPDAGS